MAPDLYWRTHYRSVFDDFAKEMGQNDFRSPVRLAVEGLKANCSDPFFTPHSKRETRAPQGVFTPDMTWRPLYFVQKANLSKSECNRYSI